MKNQRAAFLALLLCLSPLLAGCGSNGEGNVPPRVNDAIKIEPQTSLIAVPIRADLSDLAATLEREVPRTLWTIDKPGQTCVASEDIDLGIATLETPEIKCRLVGEVTRGRVTLGGEGREIRLSMPLHATIRAEDIGGILKRETAEADAMATAIIRLDLSRDWQPDGTVNLSYRWTDSPHLEFLGQRIELREQADEELRPILARLERELPGQLGQLQLRRRVEEAWNSAFTTLELNRVNPPVWMRVKPQEVLYGGYDIRDGRLRLRLGMSVLAETFVGDRPADPSPAPLPNLRPLDTDVGNFTLSVPVLADYRQLEPVLMEALRKRSRRPFDVPGVGPVRAQFRKVVIYGTENGRIAVGINFTASELDDPDDPTTGTVWMTALPVNAVNSRKVGFTDFAISGTTDMTGGDLVLKLANAPVLQSYISASLAQDFENDFEELLAKVDRAITNKREGDIVIDAQIARTRTGRIRAAGNGVFLPVRAEGTASIRLTQ